MPISLKATVLALAIFLALFVAPERADCASSNAKIVIRIDSAKAQLRGGTLVVHAVGVVRTGAMIRGGGELRRRNPNNQPNDDGLLEYELHSEAPANYKGDKLKSVKASLKESNVPAGVKGVRIYAQYNEMNAMLPVSTKKERVSKKKEFAATGEESEGTEEKAAKKKAAPGEEEPAVKKEQSAAVKKEPAVKKSVPKKEEVARAEEPPEKKSRGWNPFRRKKAPVAQVSATPAPVSKKKTAAQPVREEAAPKKEATPKREEVAPQPEEAEKKGRSWNWNPFRRKSAAAQVTATPPEAAKKETTLKKVPSPTPSPTVKEKVTKKEEEPPKKEETKKKSRWRVWNPFRREPAEPEPNR